MTATHSAPRLELADAPQPPGRVIDREAAERAAADLLAALGADLEQRWQLEDDPSRTSEVEVRFVSETPERTRVELEHRNLERHGPGWEGLRDGVDADEGWPLYLERYAEVLRS
jgi:hypothetical protein